MADQPSFDFEAARQARDIGMQRAADHADRVDDGWTETAYTNLVVLCRAHQLDAPMLGEDIRAAAYALGLPKPIEERAWGVPFVRARRAGLLAIVGYARAKSSNLSPKPLWQHTGSGL